MKNKTQNIIKYFIISALVFTCACEEYIDIDIEPEAQKIVVNSAFSNYEELQIKIYNSVSVSSHVASSTPITDAEIELFENNIYVEELRKNETFYQSNYIPKAGNTYQLQVVIPGEDTIKAESYIPQPVNITFTSADFNWHDNVCECIIRFTDPPEKNNFYLFTLDIEYQQADSSYEPFDLGTPWYYGAVDFDLIEYNIFPNGQRGLLFSDDLINGKEYDLHINLWKYSVVGNSPYRRCKLYFHLSSISEDLYLYGSSMEKQNNTSSNPFRDYFNVYSNIENGIGIFGGYYTSTETLVYMWGE